jgi:membrane protein DedA with SNARE-associated domain
VLSPEQLHGFLATYGYWAVFFFVCIESMGIPLPGETVVLLAGAWAGTHEGHILTVIAAAAAGAIVGDNIGFLVGREFGSRFLIKYGPRVGLTPARIKLGQYLFMRHGGKVVFFGRFVAILRCLAAFLAGANKMSWTRFFVANALGGVVWATIVGLVGYSFGREVHLVHGPLGVAVLAVTIGVLVWGLVYLRRHEAALQAEADAALPGPVA